MNEANSLGDDATFARKATARPQRADVSLGDQRTVGGGDAAGLDTVIDDIEVVDLEARYKIEGTLGQGGMGAVLLATDTRLDRKVAIKRILGEAARSKAAIMRFLTEAKAIAALNHPNIVQIYDYGRAKDGPFLIMEYVDGGSLLDLCAQGAMALDKAVDLACQLCNGLGLAHEQGIVHRDIKPANILINRAGLPKLSDFGLAKAQAGDYGQTTTGAVLGTPDFMPPEQRRDAAEVDHRSDLWSLAATVYQMVTGRSPKIIRFNDMPASLQAVLGKALEDLKESRYQTARELQDALKSVGASKAKSPVASDELQEGQCKACGTITSDLTKKFCRNAKCGASLRVACLKCEAPIPVWDGVCGECGGNQPALLDEKRSVLVAKRTEAESLLGARVFDQALARAGELAQETHPDLTEFAEWATSFTASTAAERDRQFALVADVEPLLHEQVLALPPIHNSIGIELKLLPAGSFTMGQAGSETPHQVTLTKPFYIGVYEVTNAQWKQVMGNVPSNWKDDDYPVEQVPWDDAMEFCRKLSALPEERKAGRVYRLPTEAEWEYACRAGTATAYSFGEDESRLEEYGWFSGNSGSQTHPVGEKRPNPWGLYDMHGNVYEWCSDWFGDYPKGEVTDPQGPSWGSGRVRRGGSWDINAWRCRSANRSGDVPSRRNDDMGFRLALSPSDSTSPEADKCE